MTESGEARQESDIAEFSLPRWLVGYAKLAHPRTLWWCRAVLASLSFLCVVSVFTHWSWLPLIPLPLFALSAFALLRTRASSDDDRLILRWMSVFIAALLVGFFLLARVANYWL